MKFKKITAAVSAAALSLSMLTAVNVSANNPQTPSDDGSYFLEFDVNGTGAYITAAYGEDSTPLDEIEEIVIPEKTEVGIPIVGIRGFAFEDCTNLKSVVVPDSITYIDDAAFLKTEDIDYLLESVGLDTAATTEEDLAYVANHISYMDRQDWNGDEDELAPAFAIFNNVLTTLIGDTDVLPSHGHVAKLLYNCPDLSLVVRSSDEDTLKKMSMKTYESFESWIKAVPYLDMTVKANEDSYAAEYAKGKELLGIKFEANASEDTDSHIIGDANQDGVINVRDAALIARALAEGRLDELIPCKDCADFNLDGIVNVRDAAAIAKYLATSKYSMKEWEEYAKTDEYIQRMICQGASEEAHKAVREEYGEGEWRTHYPTIVSYTDVDNYEISVEIYKNDERDNIHTYVLKRINGKSSFQKVN